MHFKDISGHDVQTSMSDKTRRLVCLDLNRNFKYRRIINDDNSDNNSLWCVASPPWFNRNFKLALNNQNIYSFNWNIRSIKTHKLNLRLCAFKKSVEGKPKKATSLVVIEHVLASCKRKRVKSIEWSIKSPQRLNQLAKLKTKSFLIVYKC